MFAEELLKQNGRKANVIRIRPILREQLLKLKKINILVSSDDIVENLSVVHDQEERLAIGVCGDVGDFGELTVDDMVYDEENSQINVWVSIKCDESDKKPWVYLTLSFPGINYTYSREDIALNKLIYPTKVKYTIICE